MHCLQYTIHVITKGGPIPFFFDTFNTKYRAENFTDTDSEPIPIHIAIYCNGSFIHGVNISRITILVNIRNFIFTNLLAS